MNILLDIGNLFIFISGMATGPVLGYIHQYFLIKIDKSVGSFSIDICGILLFANILRLNFYIFNHYQLALFFQSIIMITAQICLVHICTKYALNKPQITLQSSQSSTTITHTYEQTQNKQTFWRWTNFSSYMICIGIFVFSTFTVSIIFKQLQGQFYGVVVGLVALLSQSMLILPQIIQNYSKQSTKGLSRILVVLNLSGDILKLIYFLMKNQSFQFVMCGIIQVILDSFVVVQIFYYKKIQDDKFEKQNKSLVIQNKVNKNSSNNKIHSHNNNKSHSHINNKSQSTPIKNIESQSELNEIQMKTMQMISPQIQDNEILQTQQSYVNNNKESQRISLQQQQQNQQSPVDQQQMNQVQITNSQQDQQQQQQSTQKIQTY